MKHIFDFLPDDLKEFYEERAAIMHFDGGLPKEKAEALAMAEAQTCADFRKELAKRRIEIASQA